MRFGREREVERDDVGFAEETIEVGELDAARGGPIVGGEWIVGEDAGVEAFEDLGGDASDFSGADNADGFAGDVEADEAGEGEVVLAHAVEGAVDFAVEREAERDGVFGNGVGRVGGDAGDGDLEFARGVEIDVIEAGAAESDHFDAKIFESLENGAIGAVVDEEADRASAGGGGGGVAGEAEFVKAEIDLRGGGSFGKEFAIVGFGVVNGGGERGHNKVPRGNAISWISRGRNAKVCACVGFC